MIILLFWQTSPIQPCPKKPYTKKARPQGCARLACPQGNARRELRIATKTVHMLPGLRQCLELQALDLHTHAYLRVKNCIIHNVPAVVMLEDKLSSGTRLLSPTPKKLQNKWELQGPKGHTNQGLGQPKPPAVLNNNFLWWPTHCSQGLQVAASELKGRKNLFEPNTPKFENEIAPSATIFNVNDKFPKTIKLLSPKTNYIVTFSMSKSSMKNRTCKWPRFCFYFRLKYQNG